MTDNEKRAHDISIALLPKAIEYESAKNALSNNTEERVDAFRIYMENYKHALDMINDEFPHDK